MEQYIYIAVAIVVLIIAVKLLKGIISFIFTALIVAALAFVACHYYLGMF